jgi:hypothetical protein
MALVVVVVVRRPLVVAMVVGRSSTPGRLA